ncbi:S9 family peptidase [Actinomadura bangladeshensis]|uniref:Alpha/beta fold hydrolase n=1 Tax=Actinomadura bangladeshensis TaxID=453573 RepID=A0A4R4NGK2_9ACTN|nr:alpha/beta fold hydrolase [Actinomadura bangladeshensis]TDC08388.1 alpha/beta fold hydrolase [Actinomadura bangladeshensis]
MTAPAHEPVLRGLPPVATRFGFAFSGGGGWGACLRAAGDEVALERWELARPVPLRSTLTGGAAAHAEDGDGLDRRCGVLPLDDGRVLVLRPATGVDGAPAGHGTVLAAEPAGRGLRFTRSWPVPAMLAGFLLAAPGPAGTIVLVTVEDERYSRIWWLHWRLPALEAVVRIPGVLGGGVWVDGGRTLALDRTTAAHRTEGVLVDLPERAWRRAWSVSDITTDRIAAFSPRSGALAVTTTSPGAQQPGTGQIGLRFPRGGPVRFPEALNGSARPRAPLTFDAAGENLLVRETRGAAERLAVYAPDRDRLTPVPGPPGMLWPPARWAEDGRIHLRYAAPDRPPTLATVPSGHGADWWLAPDPDADFGWADAGAIELPGPAGPIETIVYGGPGWRRARHLVIALHGGPLASWRLDFEPLFQHLAAAGAAVAAPNQRGSTGYGEAHLRPVIGDWGGADLDDIVHLAREIGRDRAAAGLPGPVVLGGSYGAFLALLASCRAPRLWSGCVALAPFTSAAGLHGGASGAVRERVSRLSRCDATGAPGDGRDVLRACAAVSAPLLIVHGVRDEVVPVAQSRALRARLLELGRTEGVDFDYLEADDGHDGVVQARSPVLREAVVRFCLAAGRASLPDQERR